MVVGGSVGGSNSEVLPSGGVTSALAVLVVEAAAAKITTTANVQMNALFLGFAINRLVSVM